MIDKKEVRRRLRTERRAYPNELRIDNSEKIACNLFETDEYKNCCEVLVYISSRIEVDTSFIVERAFADGKRVLAPRCDSDCEVNHMVFCVISSLDDLESGAFKLLEPKAHCPVVTEFENALCVVPALSFDKHGQRMGFGRGYYDRFLCGFNGVSFGLCFDEFITECLPTEETDIPVNMIVTQSGVIRI